MTRLGVGARWALFLAAVLVLAALLPARAWAVEVVELDDEDGVEGYSQTFASLGFDEVSAESGFEEVDDVSVYYNGSGAQTSTGVVGTDIVWDGASGFALSCSSVASRTGVLRYAGGSLDGEEVYALVTVSVPSAARQAPTGGWSAWRESYAQYFDTFQVGVYVNAEYTCGGQYACCQALNFYCVGLAYIQVSVQFYYEDGEAAPVEGHMTCIDLDASQGFAFEDGAIQQVAVHHDSFHLEVYDSTGDGVADTVHLSQNADEPSRIDASPMSVGTYAEDPDNYRLGLVEVDFATSSSADAGMTFHTTWTGTAGNGGVQSFFAMTPEAVTYNYSSADIPIVKSVSKSEASVGDTVTYRLRIDVHEQGVTCRQGMTYAQLSVSDTLEECLSYVIGSAYVLQGSTKVTSAGQATWDESTGVFTFTFFSDFLASMDMEGESYYVVFKASVDEEPSRQTSGGTAYFDNTGELTWAFDDDDPHEATSNTVRTTLKGPGIAISKDVAQELYEVGDWIEWTVTVTNGSGATQLNDVVVSDTLPEGLTLAEENVTVTCKLEDMDNDYVYELPEDCLTVEEADGVYSWTLDATGYLMFSDNEEFITVTFLTKALAAVAGSDLVNTATAEASAVDPVSDAAETTVAEQTGDLRISKTVRGATDAAAGQEFAFTVELSGAEGSYAYTRSDGATGTLRSGETVTIGGGEYVIVSGLPAGAGYTVTEADKDGFTCTSPSSGTRTGTITADTTKLASFVNAYATSGTFTACATKTLEGGELAEGEFSFMLLDADGVQVGETATNDAEGAVAFEEVELTSEGTYAYTIVEVAGDDEDVDYDEHEASLTVVATDDGAGSLACEVSYGTDDDSSNLFVNTLHQPALSITKSASVARQTVAVGGAAEIDWTVTVTNEGDAAAVGVLITDTLPAGLAFREDVEAPDGFDVEGGQAGDDEVALSGGTLSAGASVSVTLHTTTEALSSGATYLNTAYALADEVDEASATATSRVVVQDLVIHKEVDAESYAVGDTMTWTVTLTNAGEEALEGVIVSDTLPEGLELSGGLSVSSGGEELGNAAEASCTLSGAAQADVGTYALLGQDVEAGDVIAWEDSSAGTLCLSCPQALSAGSAVALLRGDEGTAYAFTDEKTLLSLSDLDEAMAAAACELAVYAIACSWTTAEDGASWALSAEELASGASLTVTFQTTASEAVAGQTVVNTAVASAEGTDEVDDDAQADVEEAGVALPSAGAAGAALATVGALAAVAVGRRRLAGRRRRRRPRGNDLV